MTFHEKQRPRSTDSPHPINELPTRIAVGSGRQIAASGLAVTKVTLEAALVEELSWQRACHPESTTRVLDTEQGRIEQLRVPKLQTSAKHSGRCKPIEDLLSAFCL